MGRPPRRPDASILTGELIFRIGLVGLLLLIGSFGLFEWALQRGASKAEARTIAINNNARQPAALVLLVIRLCADAWPAPAGLGRNRPGKSAKRDHSGAAVENRCTTAHHCSQGLAVLLRSLSLCPRYRADPGQFPALSCVVTAALAPASA